jgi:hypothetical protein
LQGPDAGEAPAPSGIHPSEMTTASSAHPSEAPSGAHPHPNTTAE